jgi:arylsulfatase A-like enzyme
MTAPTLTPSSPVRAPTEASPLAARDPRAIFRLACWFGLLCGLAEVVARWTLYRYFDKVPLYVMHPHGAWMTQAGVLMVFATVGGLLALCTRFVPALMPPWLACAAYALLCLYCLGDIFVVESWVACAVLWLGVASAAARSAGSLQRVARRTTWLLAVAAVGVGGGVLGAAALTEYHANALAAAKTGRPNVLLITLDTVRAQDMSVYGYHRRTTPRLEAFARKGVCFDKAIATVSWTLPSHASLFTGHYPQEVFHDIARSFNDAWEAPMDDALPTIAEFLGRRGYRTGGFVANWDFGDRVFGLNRGFAHYQEYEVGFQQLLKSSFVTRTTADAVGQALDHRFVLARKSGGTVDAEFLRWLDGVSGRPFFAFLNYMDAHDPYDPPAAFAGRFTPSDEPPLPAGRPPKEAYSSEAIRLRCDYDCCLAALDQEVGRLLDELDRRALLANTLVVITADHGEHFGEHDRFKHGDTLYMPVIHVPLLIVCPGKVPAGVRVRAPASLRDVAATITDVLGLAGESPLAGASLRRLWESRTAPPEPAYSNLDMMARLTASTRPVRLRSLVDDRYHYIEGLGTPFRALYDLEHDPAEENDLSGVPDKENVIERLRAALPQR